MEHSGIIFALSSGESKAAVRVIRVSGLGLGAVLQALGLGALPPRLACLRSLRDPKTHELIDRGLVIWFPTPSSFTGEDCLELHLHGSLSVDRAILRVLANIPNCRLARPGEFAWRAFVNGKLDLASAEGLVDLLDAKTDLQRRQALAQSGGVLSQASVQWKSSLLGCLALVEAEIDFDDEADVPHDNAALVFKEVRQLVRVFEQEIRNFQRAEVIREGFRVFIMGPPNAGKSSLMNFLLQREASIVTDRPGTTRDLIEATIDVGGAAIVLVDTAGIHESNDEVEQIGIFRSLSRASEAQLVLWLCPGTSLPTPPVELAKKAIIVRSKSDLICKMDCFPGISTVTGQGIDDLLHIIRERASVFLDCPESNLITQERQLILVQAARDQLDELLCQEHDIVVVAELLRNAAKILELLTGRIEAEDVLGSIFSKFCIGK